MAKKPKGFGKLLRQNRQEGNQEDALRRLEKRVQQGAIGNKIAGVLRNPEGQEKMSDVLEAFVEPYLDDAKTFDQQQKLFAIAIVAWNLAIMPADQRPAELEKFVQSMAGRNKQMRQDITGILEDFIERKQQFFANNKRHVIDFELRKMGNTYHLSVASTFT